MDLWCERDAPGLWNEPLNALSNLAFILAGYLVLRLYRKHINGRMRDVECMLALIFLIGIGSGLFHTMATGYSYLADIIPIGLFQLVFMYVYMRRVAGWGWVGMLGGFAAFGAATYAFTHLLFDSQAFGGAVRYFAAILVIILMSIQQMRRGSGTAHYYALAAVLLVLALTCRVVDLPVCDNFTHGTHFLWHIFNGTMIYVVVRGLLFTLRGRVV